MRDTNGQVYPIDKIEKFSLPPFDAISYGEGDGTRISGIVEGPPVEAPALLYSAFVGVTGNSPQQAMQGKLALLVTCVSKNPDL